MHGRGLALRRLGSPPLPSVLSVGVRERVWGSKRNFCGVEKIAVTLRPLPSPVAEGFVRGSSPTRSGSDSLRGSQVHSVHTTLLLAHWRGDAWASAAPVQLACPVPGLQVPVLLALLPGHWPWCPLSPRSSSRWRSAPGLAGGQCSSSLPLRRAWLLQWRRGAQSQGMLRLGCQ